MMRAGGRMLQKQRKLLPHCRGALWRHKLRDDWQQNRKYPDWSTMMVLPEISGRTEWKICPAPSKAKQNV